MSIKKYIIYAIAALIFVGIVWFFHHKYKSILSENYRLQNNIEYYSALGQENRVLQMTIEELQNSRDSVIVELDSLRTILKIKPKEIKTIVFETQVICDTIRDTIPNTLNFEALVQPNSQTFIEVIRRDTSLMVIPNITNDQALFITCKKRYKYKGFFNRLIHFNFKKITYYGYQINNSNNLIKITDTRVINIEEQ